MRKKVFLILSICILGFTGCENRSEIDGLWYQVEESNGPALFLPRNFLAFENGEISRLLFQIGEAMQILEPKPFEIKQDSLIAVADTIRYSFTLHNDSLTLKYLAEPLDNEVVLFKKVQGKKQAYFDRSLLIGSWDYVQTIGGRRHSEKIQINEDSTMLREFSPHASGRKITDWQVTYFNDYVFFYTLDFLSPGLINSFNQYTISINSPADSSLVLTLERRK